MVQKKEIRLEDIARELNVSIVSVSNALKGKKGVGRELRQKVIEKADELGYRPLHPSGEKGTAKYCIGIMMAEKYLKKIPSLYLEIYRHASRMISEIGGTVILEIVHADMEEILLQDSCFKETAVDGIIFIGEMDIEFIRGMREKTGAQAVGIDFYNLDEAMDYIVLDDFQGGQYITWQLIDMGYRHIGFSGDPYASHRVMDCYMGYCKTLKLNHAEKDKPEAYVVCSDNGAYTRLPDMPEGAFLTGYEYNAEALAQNGVEMLLGRLSGERSAEAVWRTECRFMYGPHCKSGEHRSDLKVYEP